MSSRRSMIPVLPPSCKHGGAEGVGVFSYVAFEKSMANCPRRSRTHRHAFHELMIFHGGEGVFSGDFHEHGIKAPAVVVIPAGVVHWWPVHDSLRGSVLGFDADFLGLESRADEGMALFAPPVRPVLAFDDEAGERMKSWLSLIAEEWHGEALGRREMLRAALAALLVETRRASLRLTPAPLPAAAEPIYQKFLVELEKQVTAMPSPRSLARALGMTPDHLSACLRAVASRPAGALIADRILLEAKRLLAHSNLSVAETAYALSFESPSYFARFFRKHAGLSPKEFRILMEAA